MNASLSLTRPNLRLIASGLAVALLAASLMGSAAATAQAGSAEGDDTLRTLSVNGTGRVKSVPDVATINVGVSEQAKEAGAASQKAAASMDSVVQALLGLGIDEKDIQTTSINLGARYDWDAQPAKIIGWEASNMVSVTVRDDIESVGDVIDTVVNAGANQINGISFRVEDPSKAQALARTAAVDDARAKADQLAADAGVEIVGIISITESGGQQPQPIYAARQEMAFADSAASTPVLAGEVELAVNVFIQYEIA